MRPSSSAALCHSQPVQASQAAFPCGIVTSDVSTGLAWVFKTENHSSEISQCPTPPCGQTPELCLSQPTVAPSWVPSSQAGAAAVTALPTTASRAIAASEPHEDAALFALIAEAKAIDALQKEIGVAEEAAYDRIISARMAERAQPKARRPFLGSAAAPRKIRRIRFSQLARSGREYRATGPRLNAVASPHGRGNQNPRSRDHRRLGYLSSRHGQGQGILVAR